MTDDFFEVNPMQSYRLGPAVTELPYLHLSDVINDEDLSLTSWTDRNLPMEVIAIPANFSRGKFHCFTWDDIQNIYNRDTSRRNHGHPINPYTRERLPTNINHISRYARLLIPRSHHSTELLIQALKDDNERMRIALDSMSRENYQYKTQLTIIQQ